MAIEVRKLHQCNVYLDAVAYVGIASEVTLPVVKPQLKEHAPTSMKGKIDVPLGNEKMTLQITGDFDEAFTVAASDFYNTRIVELRSTLVVFDGSGRTEERSVKATMRVLFQGYEPTAFKNGDVAELKYTAGVHTYKLEVEGTVIHDTNLLGNQHTVAGVELNSKNNKLLGL